MPSRPFHGTLGFGSLGANESAADVNALWAQAANAGVTINEKFLKPYGANLASVVYAYEGGVLPRFESDIAYKKADKRNIIEAFWLVWGQFDSWTKVFNSPTDRARYNEALWADFFRSFIVVFGQMRVQMTLALRNQGVLGTQSSSSASTSSSSECDPTVASCGPTVPASVQPTPSGDVYVAPMTPPPNGGKSDTGMGILPIAIAGIFVVGIIMAMGKSE